MPTRWCLQDVLGRYVNQYTVASPVGERPVTSDDRGGGTTPDGQAQAPRTDVPALAGLSPAEQPTASGCHPDFQQDKSSAASGKPVERQQNSNGTPGGAGHTNPAENHFQLQRPGKDQQDIYRKALEAIHHRLPTNGNIAGTSTNAVEGNAMTVTQRLGGLSQDPGGHTSLSGASGTAVQLAGLNREEEKRRITPVPLAESTAQPQDPGAGTLEGQHPRRRVHPAPMLATHGIAGSGVGVQQPGQANKDWEKPNRALDLLLVPPEAGSSGDGMQREQQNGEINPEKVKVLRKVIPDPMPPQGTSKGNGATVTPAKADSQAVSAPRESAARVVFLRTDFPGVSVQLLSSKTTQRMRKWLQDGSAAVVSSRKRVTPIPVEVGPALIPHLTSTAADQDASFLAIPVLVASVFSISVRFSRISGCYSESFRLWRVMPLP